MKRSSEWRPGSFTKNFSWGGATNGFRHLHEAIKTGFGEEPIDVQRHIFRNRIETISRPDYIAINFFLYNKIVSGIDYLAVDELVFQAVNFRHSTRFDALAFFAFNLSLAGHWKGAEGYQRNPAQWAYHYVGDRFGPYHDWDLSKVTADDIEAFIKEDGRYVGETTRKLATNYNHMFSLLPRELLKEKEVRSWWVDALFLALDRYILDQSQTENTPTLNDYEKYLEDVGFWRLGGKESTSKRQAARHFLQLYSECGGIRRFSYDDVILRTKDIMGYLSNEQRPIAGTVLVVHPSNPHARKFLPRVCAMLAKYAGFSTFEIEEDEQFELTKFVREHTRQAVKRLSDSGIRPMISAKELMRLMRDE